MFYATVSLASSLVDSCNRLHRNVGRFLLGLSCDRTQSGVLFLPRYDTARRSMCCCSPTNALAQISYRKWRQRELNKPSAFIISVPLIVAFEFVRKRVSTRLESRICESPKLELNTTASNESICGFDVWYLKTKYLKLVQ